MTETRNHVVKNSFLAKDNFHRAFDTIFIYRRKRENASGFWNVTCFNKKQCHICSQERMKLSIRRNCRFVDNFRLKLSIRRNNRLIANHRFAENYRFAVKCRFVEIIDSPKLSIRRKFHLNHKVCLLMTH